MTTSTPGDLADRTLLGLVQGLSSAMSLARVADVLAEEGARAVGAAWCNVALAEPDGVVLRVVFPHVDEASQSWEHLPVVAETPLTLAFRTGTPVTVEGRDEIARRFPVLARVTAEIGVDRIVAFPLRDQAGTVFGSIGFASDRQRHPPASWNRLELVTEVAAQALGRARLLEREHATASRLDAVLRDVPVGVLAVDRDGRVLVRNEAYDRLVRSSRPILTIDDIEIERRRADDGSSLTLDQLPLSRAMRGDAVQAARVAVDRPDGSNIVLHVDAAPVCDDDGHIIGAVATVADAEHLDRLDRERALVRALIRLAGSAVDDSAALSLAAAAAVPALADLAAVYAHDGGSLREVAAAGGHLVVPGSDEERAIPGLVERSATEQRIAHLVAEPGSTLDGWFLDGRPLRSVVALPLAGDGAPSGAVLLGCLRPGAFDDHRVELAGILTDRLAGTVARLRADVARDEAIARAETLAERLARLQSVVDASLSGLDLDTLFATLLNRLRDALDSDTASVLLLDEDAGVLRPWPSIGITERPGPDFVVPIGEGFSGRIAATGRPHQLTDVTSSDLATGLLLRAGLRSLLGVPLTLDDRVLGVLHVGSRTRRWWDDDDVEFLTAAAARIATTVDRTRRHEAERSARRAAQAAAARTERLWVAAARLAPRLGAADAARVVAEEAAALLDAARVAVVIDGLPVAVVPEGSALVVDDVVPTEAHPRPPDRATPTERLVVPVPEGSAVTGRLVAELSPPRCLDADDLGALTALLDQFAQALDRARLDELIRIERAREHEVAIELQRSLLPSELVTPPWLGASARYLAGSSFLSVGGDWYDVVHRPDGSVIAVTGDVVGHGLRQAAVMGQLRSACAALALQCEGPSELLDRLEQFARTVPGADFTTMCAAWIGPSTARVRVASAGHPPPLLVDGDGGTRFVEGGLRPPLGCLDRGSTSGEVEIDVHGGETLLLYTDGLVERRVRSIDDGMAALSSTASSHHDRPLEVFTERLVAELTADVDLHDDVAVLALRASSARRGPYRRRVAAVPASLAVLRGDLRSWIAPLDVGPAVEGDVLLAVGEACANAIEHGSRSRPDACVALTLRIDAGDLVAEIDDAGRWLDRPSAPDRGRGLSIMRGVCRDVAVDARDDGTTVTLRLDLTAR